MPPLLVLLFPERPRSSALRPVALLSALEALPSGGVASLPASPAPLLFAGFFTSLLVFFNLSCARIASGQLKPYVNASVLSLLRMLDTWRLFN